MGGFRAGIRTDLWRCFDVSFAVFFSLFDVVFQQDLMLFFSSLLCCFYAVFQQLLKHFRTEFYGAFVAFLWYLKADI